MGDVHVATRRAHSRRRRMLVTAMASTAMTAASFAVAGSTSVAADNSNPSAIGDELAASIAVSPSFATSGVAAVASRAIGCQSACDHLWVTRNGGNTWSRAQASGWQQGSLSIGVDAGGAEFLYSSNNSNVQRSADFGKTWTNIGGGGVATVAPDFTSNGRVAVAGGNNSDYVVRSSGTSSVAGSGGTMHDVSFGFPADGAGSAGRAAAFVSGVDPNTAAPEIEPCDSKLACSGMTPLPGANQYTGPASLLFSADFGNDGAVFARTTTTLYKSTDGGRTFAAAPVISTSPGATTGYEGMALAPNYREHGNAVAYLAIVELPPAPPQGKTPPPTSGGVFRTTDGGSTWAQVGSPGPLDHGALAVAAGPGGRLFASYIASGAQAGLVCSADGGATWHATCPAMGNGGSQASGSHSGGGVAGCTAASCAGGAAPGSTPGGAGGSSSPNAAGGNGSASGAGGGSAQQPSRPIAATPRGRNLPTVPLVIAGLLLLLGVGSAILRRSRTRAESASRAEM